MVKSKATFVKNYDPAWETFVMRSFAVEPGRTIAEVIIETVNELILARVLRKDDPMPSTHRLGEHMGVARYAVQHAYSELVRRGTLKTATRAGTWIVSARPPYRKAIIDVLATGRRLGLSYEEIQADMLVSLKSLKSELRKRRQL